MKCTFEKFPCMILKDNHITYLPWTMEMHAVCTLNKHESDETPTFQPSWFLLSFVFFTLKITRITLFYQQCVLSSAGAWFGCFASKMNAQLDSGLISLCFMSVFLVIQCQMKHRRVFFPNIGQGASANVLYNIILSDRN